MLFSNIWAGDAKLFLPVLGLEFHQVLSQWLCSKILLQNYHETKLITARWIV